MFRYITLRYNENECIDVVAILEDSLTGEKVFLSIDKVIGGLVHLNLTLPRLRHVPHPRVAGYHVKLKEEKR